MDIPLTLQPKQSTLWDYWDDESTDVIGFGGARGGAKSGGGRRGILLRRLKYPNTTGLILRRTFPALYKSHIVKMFEEWPMLRHFYNTTNKELHLPNGSRLFFGSAQHEGDMDAFYSPEFADLLIDEAQEFSQFELEKLDGSNRCTSNSQIKPKKVVTFMPGLSEEKLAPRGLLYLKRVFVEGKRKGNELKKNWKFIQAFAWDNYEWARKELEAAGISADEFYSWPDTVRRDFFIEHTDFGRMLAGLTNEGLRDAWLYGKWDTFQGQYFPQFEEGKHVIGRAELNDRLKPWHKQWGCGDWGFDHPHAFYRMAQDETGKVRVYGEIWGREVNEADLGKSIGVEWSGAKLQAFPISWDAGKLSKRSSPKFPRSIQDAIGDAMPQAMQTMRPHPADSSPGSRIAGARLLSQILDSNMIEICEDCPHLIECLPTLVRDPDNPEDVLKVDYSENGVGDDPYDAVRMGAQHMLGAPLAPKIIDQTQVMQHAQFQTTTDFKAQRMMTRFDKTFGKDPNDNEWFPKP